jgi:hypothetical protein
MKLHNMLKNFAFVLLFFYSFSIQAEWIELSSGKTKINNVSLKNELDVTTIRQVDDAILVWTRISLTDEKDQPIKGRNVIAPAYRYYLNSINCKDLKSAIIHVSVKDENDFEFYKTTEQESPQYHTPGSNQYNLNNIACLVKIGHKLPSKKAEIIAVKANPVSSNININFDRLTIFHNESLSYVWVNSNDENFFPKILTYYEFDCKKATGRVVGSYKKFTHASILEINLKSQSTPLDISEILRNKIKFICPEI